MRRNIGRWYAAAALALAAPTAAWAQTTNIGTPHGSSGATDPVTGSTGEHQEIEQKRAGTGTTASTPDKQPIAPDQGKRAGSPLEATVPGSGTPSTDLPGGTPEQRSARPTQDQASSPTPTTGRTSSSRPSGRRQADRPSRGAGESQSGTNRAPVEVDQENDASKAGPGPVAPRSPGQVGTTTSP